VIAADPLGAAKRARPVNRDRTFDCRLRAAAWAGAQPRMAEDGNFGSRGIRPKAEGENCRLEPLLARLAWLSRLQPRGSMALRDRDGLTWRERKIARRWARCAQAHFQHERRAGRAGRRKSEGCRCSDAVRRDKPVALGCLAARKRVDEPRCNDKGAAAAGQRLRGEPSPTLIGLPGGRSMREKRKGPIHKTR